MDEEPEVAQLLGASWAAATSQVTMPTQVSSTKGAADGQPTDQVVEPIGNGDQVAERPVRG